MDLSPIVDHAYMLNVTPDQHHAEDHKARHQKDGADDLESLLCLANFSEKSHLSLTNVTADQHHAQAHTLASHSTKAHTELTGVTASQHHIKTTSFADLVDTIANAQTPNTLLKDGSRRIDPGIAITRTGGNPWLNFYEATTVRADVFYDISSNELVLRNREVSNKDLRLDELGNVTLPGTVDGVDISAHAANVNAHHAQAHTLASHSTRAHSELTDVSTSQHHTKYTNAEAVAAVEAEDPLNLAGAVTMVAGKNIAGPNTFMHKNPDNLAASVFLQWVVIDSENWPTIRYGGTGEGATRGFLIQGPGNATKLRIDDAGDLTPTRHIIMGGGRTVDGVDISAHAANANAHHTKFTTTEHDTTARHSLGSVVPHDALASLTEKSHASLTNVTSDQHHPQSHTLASHSTKAHTELTGVSASQHHSITNVKRIIMQEPKTALNLTNRSDTAYTDLDLTAFTSVNADGAFLRLTVTDDGDRGWAKVRKKGQTSLEGALIAINWAAGSWGLSVGYVELDVARKIQYFLDATGANTLDVKIFVFGYTEPVS